MLKRVLTEYVSAALPDMTPMEKTLLVRDLSRLAESWAKTPRDERTQRLSESVEKLGAKSASSVKAIRLELVVSKKRLNEEQIRERTNQYAGSLAKRLAVVGSDANSNLEEPVFELTPLRSDDKVSVYRVNLKGRAITQKRVRSASDHLSKQVKLPLNMTLFEDIADVA